MQQALNVGAPEVAQKALRHASEFGLSHDSYKEFHPLMIYYSKQGALQSMFEVFEFMRGHGRRPGPETCYILVKGCVDHGRPDLAEVGGAVGAGAVGGWVVGRMGGWANGWANGWVGGWGAGAVGLGGGGWGEKGC
jgi:hypothetical protein